MKCLLPPLLLAQGHAVHGELSIYNSSTSRADAIASSRVLIKNERRNITIGTTTYQYYDGPVAQNASLTELLRFSEINPILNNRTTYAWYMAAIIQSETAVGHLNSMEGIAKIYDLASDQLPKPMATDISDVTFGRERLTTKAMKLRQVRLNEYSNTTFQLSDAKLSDICGKDVVWKNIRDKNALYVEDYHDIAEWNDKSAPEKYVPNVVGFFCYNDKSAELLPVEIHYPDTKLSYTPFDAKEEWTLAKMGLNAASVSHHQWQHMAETHATMVPIRVELIRNMAFEHPVRSLIEHHARNDLGLESLMPEFLFNRGTMMDDSFGWGGTGSLRYLVHQTLELDGDFEQDFLTEMESRGILDLHIHKYAQYGSKMYDAIRVFVEKYVVVYYALDQVVVEDRELQNWARDCAVVTHLKGFPAKIATREQLVKVLARLIYLDGVKHHAMNGATTWASIALPYSNAALWSPMPTHKGEKIDLMKYTVPTSKLVSAVGMQYSSSARFLRISPGVWCTMPRCSRTSLGLLQLLQISRPH